MEGTVEHSFFEPKRTKYGRQRRIDQAKLAKRRAIKLREKGIETERICKDLLVVYGKDIVEHHIEYYVDRS